MTSITEIDLIGLLCRSQKYRLYQKKLYGSVGCVYSMLYSLALTHCALLTVLDYSLKDLAHENVIHTTNTKQMIRR